MSTCTHPNAEALQTAACGEDEAWMCDSDYPGQCGAGFVVVKKHQVLPSTRHTQGCVGGMHAVFGACGCGSIRVLSCMNCPEDFPVDTDRQDVEIWN